MEARPGEEVQVDFGLGAPIWEGPGRPRRSWVLRMVLSYSRKGYSKAVLRQDTETFLRCLENGLRAFDGVPLLLNIDFVPRNKIDVMCPATLCGLHA
jgi:transposase